MKRSTILIVAIAAVLMSTPATAQKLAEKLTVQQVLPLVEALRSLDSHSVIVKDPAGRESVVQMPWNFGSAATRLRIANNMTIANMILQHAETARLAIIKELTKSGASDIKPGTAEFDDFQRQYKELLEQPASGSQDFARLKASDLRLDKNEISISVLSALGPILDNDLDQK